MMMLRELFKYSCLPLLVMATPTALPGNVVDLVKTTFGSTRNTVLMNRFKNKFTKEWEILSTALPLDVIIDGLVERSISSLTSLQNLMNTSEFKDRLTLAIALVKFYGESHDLDSYWDDFEDAFKTILSQYHNPGGILKKIMPIKHLSDSKLEDFDEFSSFLTRKVKTLSNLPDTLMGKIIFIRELCKRNHDICNYFIIAASNSPTSKAIQLKVPDLWLRMSKEFNPHWEEMLKNRNLFQGCNDIVCVAQRLPNLQDHVLSIIEEGDNTLDKEPVIDSISGALDISYSLEHLNSLTFRELKSLETSVLEGADLTSEVLSLPHIFDDPSILLNKRIIPWAIKDFVARKLDEFVLGLAESKHALSISTIVRYMSAKELLEEIKQMQFEDSEDVWGQIKVSLSKYFDSKPSIEKISLLLKGIGEEDKSFRDTSIRLSKVGHSKDVAIIEKDGKFMFQESFCHEIGIVDCYLKLKKTLLEDFKYDEIISQEMEIKILGLEPQIKWDSKLITDPYDSMYVENYSIVKGSTRVPSNYENLNEGKAFDFTFWRYIHESKEATEDVDEHVIFINGGPGGFGHEYIWEMNQMAEIKKTIAFYVFDHRGLGESGQFHPDGTSDLQWFQINEFIDNLFNREIFPFPLKDLTHRNASFDLGMFCQAIKNEDGSRSAKTSLFDFSYGSLLANQTIYEFPNYFDKVMTGGVTGPERFEDSMKGMMDVCEETPECVNLLGGNLDARMEEAIKGLLFNYTKNECQEGFLKAFQPKPSNLPEFGYSVEPLMDLSFITGLSAVILSLECNENYKGAYLEKMTEIKALLESKLNVITGSSGVDMFVNKVVNLNIAGDYIDDSKLATLPFHNQWSHKVLLAAQNDNIREHMDPGLLGKSSKPQASASSVTPVFQFQSMLDLVTPYIGADETFRAMNVPMKTSLLFRNYGHTVPKCDAMREYFLKWLSLPRNTIVGQRGMFARLVKACDVLEEIPWGTYIREFFPKDYEASPQDLQSNYQPPQFFECKINLHGGSINEIDCS